MGKVEEWYIITSVNEFYTNIHHDYKITSWKQPMMVIVEAQDKTINKGALRKVLNIFKP